MKVRRSKLTIAIGIRKGKCGVGARGISRRLKVCRRMSYPFRE